MTPGFETLSAEDVIELLQLSPHPEGGFFRETFRDSSRRADGRSASTAIYYLLAKGQTSAWHRVDAVEIWHYYAGAPLELLTSADGRLAKRSRLGPALNSSEQPQLIVSEREWQSATSCGNWSLVGCTVAPGFEFSAFELAPAGFRPSL
jgi:uncharacterized protein